MRYDETDPIDIERYGKEMIGMSFREIFERAVAEGNPLVADKKYMAIHADKNFKGGMGNLVEECWFGYKANSNPEPDFEKAGVELKVTPYKAVKKGFSAKERLVLTLIDYMEVYKEKDLLSSHLWKKLGCILLAWYLHKDGQNDIDSTVDFVQLFTLPAEDLEIIKTDYRKILAKIEAGKAEDLSEGDTLYLGACTKGSSAKSVRKQPFSDVEAKQRAFSLKNSYMTYLLNEYILKQQPTYHYEGQNRDEESIISSDVLVDDLEKYVQRKIAAYIGRSEDELAVALEMGSNAKNRYAMLAYRMLGIKGNSAQEFRKANIVVKTIRIQKNGKIKESMSFSPFDFQALAKTEWENSVFGNFLQEQRFFFVLFQEGEDGIYRLKGSCFWNMPYHDIEGPVREVWERTRDIFRDGKLMLDITPGGLVRNNLPKASDNMICHVRPHGADRSDMIPLPKGTHLTVRSNRSKDFEWPDDTMFSKQCFWLNNDYILSQLRMHFAGTKKA